MFIITLILMIFNKRVLLKNYDIQFYSIQNYFYSAFYNFMMLQNKLYISLDSSNRQRRKENIIYMEFILTCNYRHFCSTM